MLTPFPDFLDDIGAPVERELEAAKLPPDIFRGPEAYLPTRALNEFVAYAGRSQGIDNIGLGVSEGLGIETLQPQYRMALAASATLYDCLQTLCAHARLQSSRSRLWLRGSGGALYLYHQGSYPPEVAGQFEMTWWTLVQGSSIGAFFKPDFLKSLLKRAS